MPRPSQCRACGGYEICLWPGTPGCAEDEERGMTLRDRDVCLAAEMADIHDTIDLVHSHDLEPVEECETRKLRYPGRPGN